MSPRLPVISGEFLLKVLAKIGYSVVRQRGSHLRLKDTTNPFHKPLPVPLHKEIKPGLLRKIIKDADLSVEEFVRLLEK